MKKWFTIATEGQTTDGRKIMREWLTQAAETFNSKTYAARVWLEHLRSTLPDGPFKAYGDVTALRTQESDDGKLVLQAQIDPHPSLVAMNKDRQKMYTSAELNLDFAGSGKAYLVGLAVTDSPASLGTDILAFCAQNPTASPFTERKQSAGNLFTSSLETVFEFSNTEPVPESDQAWGFVTKLTEVFKSLSGPKLATEKLTELTQAVTEFTAQYADQQQSTRSELTALQTQLDAFKTGYVSVEAFNALQAKLDLTERPTPTRPTATGGDGALRADC